MPDTETVLSDSETVPNCETVIVRRPSQASMEQGSKAAQVSPNTKRMSVRPTDDNTVDLAASWYMDVSVKRSLSLHVTTGRGEAKVMPKTSKDGV